MTTDSDIIRRSRESPAAFAALYDKYARSVYRYAARRAGEAAAEDVMSETFLVAFEGRDGFDHAWDDARPWLFGIATNLLRRHRHAEARALRALARAAPKEGLDDDADGVAARVDALAATTRIAGALAGLSATDRECLLLYAWADLTYEGIAQAMDVPVGTVRSRLNRARRILRESARFDQTQEAEMESWTS